MSVSHIIPIAILVLTAMGWLTVLAEQNDGTARFSTEIDKNGAIIKLHAGDESVPFSVGWPPDYRGNIGQHCVQYNVADLDSSGFTFYFRPDNHQNWRPVTRRSQFGPWPRQTVHFKIEADRSTKLRVLYSNNTCGIYHNLILTDFYDGERVKVTTGKKTYYISKGSPLIADFNITGQVCVFSEFEGATRIRSGNYFGFFAKRSGRVPITVWATLGACASQESKPPDPKDAAPQAIRLSHNQRMQVQRGLTKLGYDTFGVDGKFGPKTRSAIRRWQISNGHQVTGTITSTQFSAIVRDARTARQKTPSAATPTGRYVDGRGCLREASGQIVANYKEGC